MYNYTIIICITYNHVINILSMIKYDNTVDASAAALASLRRTRGTAGCALHGASQLVESASGLFGDAAADVLTGLGD